jgi:hypothetical protein
MQRSCHGGTLRAPLISCADVVFCLNFLRADECRICRSANFNSHFGTNDRFAAETSPCTRQPEGHSRVTYLHQTYIDTGVALVHRACNSNAALLNWKVKGRAVCVNFEAATLA